MKRVEQRLVLVVLIALLVGAASSWTMYRASGWTGSIAQAYLPMGETSREFESEVLNARIHFIYYVTIQKPGSKEKGWERFGRAETILPKLRELVNSKPELAPMQPQVGDLEADLGSYRTALTKILDTVDRKENSGPGFAAQIAEWARLGGRLVDGAGVAGKKSADLMEEAAKSSSNALARMFALVGWLGSVTLLGVAAWAMWGLRSMENRMTRLAGDLTERATTVLRVSEGMEQLLHEWEHNAETQSATVQSAAAAGDEVRQMAQRNAEHSMRAAEAMQLSQTEMRQLESETGEVISRTNEIQASSSQIAKVNKVIDEIAFQTNILALNAAVEAARAGEAGMGFAVVADEVRNLAQRSAQSARDATAMIEASQANANAGKGTAENLGMVVRRMAAQAQETAKLVAQVQAASQEQQQGIGQIADSLERLDREQAHTAGSAKKAAQSILGLEEVSSGLRQSVAHLEELVGQAS